MSACRLVQHSGPLALPWYLNYRHGGCIDRVFSLPHAIRRMHMFKSRVLQPQTTIDTTLSPTLTCSPAWLPPGRSPWIWLFLFFVVKSSKYLVALQLRSLKRLAVFTPNSLVGFPQQNDIPNVQNFRMAWLRSIEVLAFNRPQLEHDWCMRIT